MPLVQSPAFETQYPGVAVTVIEIVTGVVTCSGMAVFWSYVVATRTRWAVPGLPAEMVHDQVPVMADVRTGCRSEVSLSHVTSWQEA